MKKKFDKEFEKVSAYLDGELSETEKSLLEDKLKHSSVLRDTLSDYDKLKNLTGSVKPLQEDNYFETRLTEKIKSQKKGVLSLTHLLKPALISALAVVVVFAFIKLEPDFVTGLFSKHKNILVDFYTKNLQPLIYTANLSNEDIFDFAFNKRLPIDKENQRVLSLGVDIKGRGYFEVKYAGDIANAFNLESFARSLKLNAHQKKDVDSILKSYSGEIASQVLVNDKNTLAVNSKIWNCQNAIRTDLINYAAAVNKNVAQRILPSNYSLPVVNNFKRSFANGNNNTIEEVYFFITPDTVFSREITINKGILQNEIAKMRDEFNKNDKEIKSFFKNFDFKVFRNDTANGNDFAITVDTNLFKVSIPEICSPDKFMPDFDSMNSMLEEAAANLMNFNSSIDFGFDPFDNEAHLRFKNMPDSSQSYNFRFKSPQFNGSNPDSLNNMYKFFFNDDSIEVMLPKEFPKEMEQFRQEMEKFRQEMEQFRDEMKEKTNKAKTKKPIEL